MVIYEVNLEIQKSIFDDYYQWLLDHAAKMLQFEGFQKAEIGEVESDSKTSRQLRVSYHIDNYQRLQQYLTVSAKEMRAEAEHKFGKKFKAHRRVVIDPVTLQSV